jgi:hypothetical protein
MYTGFVARFALKSVSRRGGTVTYLRTAVHFCGVVVALYSARRQNIEINERACDVTGKLD